MNAMLIGSDLRHGLGQPIEEIVVAGLVIMPFVLTAVVLLGWMLPLSASGAMLLFVAALVPTALWNAGWRARPDGR